MASTTTYPNTMPLPHSPLPPHRLKLILLSGASGTGKSTTAYEVCARLRGRTAQASQQQGGMTSQQATRTEQVQVQVHAHAHIEADNLDAMYPRRRCEGDGTEKVMLRGLRALWGVLWGEMAAVLATGTGTARGLDQGVKRDGDRQEADGETAAAAAAGREGGGGRLAVLVVSGTAVVLELDGVRKVVEEVVQAAVGPGAGGGDSAEPLLRQRVEVEVLPVVLGAKEDLVEARLRGRVLGEELQDHLDSSRKFRRVLGQWEPGDGPAGGGGGGGGGGGVVVRRVDSGRDLSGVVDDVLRVCGL